jgi:hypothetical protein
LITVNVPTVSTSNGAEFMDDTTLIQNFVAGFAEGKSVLLCNGNLRTEPLHSARAMQLLSKRDGVISTAKFQATAQSAVVKHTSNYWQLIHQALLDKQCFPVLTRPAQGCYQYFPGLIPEGYSLYCTSARELWRMFWGQSSFNRAGISLEILIYCFGPTGKVENWYPVRGMECREGKLVINLLGKEEVLQSTDMVVWVKRAEFRDQQRRVRPDLRSYVAPRPRAIY